MDDVTKDMHISEYDCRLCKNNTQYSKDCYGCAGNFKKPNFEISDVPICINGKWYNPSELQFRTQLNNKVE